MSKRSLPRVLWVVVAAVAIACGGPSPTQSPQLTLTPPPPSAPAPASPGAPGATHATFAPPPPSDFGPPTPTPPPSTTPVPTPLPSGPPTPPRTFTADTGMAAQLGPQLQAVLDQQQQQTGSPGIGAAITFPDGSIWSSGSGNAIADPAEPATGDVPFVVGSISKTFATAVIMQLAGEGKLSLDDPLANWLPDYPNGANITIRELLHHTSGIFDYFDAPNYDSLVFQTMAGHSWKPDEILSTFAHAPYFAPGTAYHYSNTDFILLGQIIEQITGQKLGDVYAQRLFTPLGLTDTYFQGNGPPAADAAQGYLEKATGLKEISDTSGYRPTISAATVAWAAGGIDASAKDIAMWGDALYGGHVVDQQYLAQMEQWTYYPPPIDETYGLGTRSRVIEGERVFGHTGSIRGFDAAMWHFPQTDMTISVLTNLGRIDANPIADALAAVAYPTAQGTGVAGPAGRLTLASSDAAQLQSILDRQRTTRHIPGVGAAVIFPDGSVWKSGSGSAQLTTHSAATATIPFVVGSVTKTFVTATIFQLAEEGKLSIDDPLSTWLPDYPNAAQITLRELLGHTSGVYNYFENPKYNKLVFQTDKTHYWTPQEILADFVRKPYCAPGTCFHYSNTGFILLGLVVEQVTGLPLGTVFKQRFFKPLGLRHTYFQGTAAPPSSSAKGYLYKSHAWKEWSDATNYRPTISAASVAWAAGGIVSSARDIAKWAAALYGGHVVSADDLAQMENFDYAPGSNETYGLGTWSRVDANGVRMFGHTGSLRGFDAAMWFYPTSGLTVVVLTNLGRIDVDPITDALAAAALPVASAYAR